MIKNSAGVAQSYSVRSRKFSRPGDDYGYFQIKLSKDLVVGEQYTVEVSGDVCGENGIKLAAPMKLQPLRLSMPLSILS